MTYRFYSPQLTAAGTVILDDTEAHHLAHVLRAQVDDQVELFDGLGNRALCRIAIIRKRDVQLEVVTYRPGHPPAGGVVIASAVPKGDRFDWMIEKATELGVRRLIPLTTARSVVDPRSSKLEKLRQTVVAACKQCGRNDLMEITPVRSWETFVGELQPSDQQILIAHPHGVSLSGIPSLNRPADGAPFERPVIVAIGPEGGFTDEEIQRAEKAGATTIQLGNQILRIETAAIALAARLLL